MAHLPSGYTASPFPAPVENPGAHCFHRASAAPYFSLPGMDTFLSPAPIGWLLLLLLLLGELEKFPTSWFFFFSLQSSPLA